VFGKGPFLRKHTFFPLVLLVIVSLLPASGALAQAGLGLGAGAGLDFRSLLQGLPAAASGSTASAAEQAEQVDQSGAFRVVPRAVRPFTNNEFQRFIQNTIGESLPIYGQELFELGEMDSIQGSRDQRPAGNLLSEDQNPSQNPFGPIAATPVSGDYLIGPGDEIIVKVFSPTFDLDQRLVVGRDGIVVIPKVGPVQIAGVRASELERRLKSVLSRTLSDFNVYATVGRLRGIDVYIVGQARNPGRYTVSSMSTAISALFATGGPSSFGSFRAIEIVRSGKVVATIDLYTFMSGRSGPHDMRLVQGDVLHIPPVGRQVALLGALQKPAVYELAPGSKVTTLDDLLALSGGLPVTTNPLDIIWERADPQRARPLSAQRFALDDAGRRQPLRDGDILRFFPIKPAFTNAIVLRLLDQPPVRVPISPGDRIRDVIPSPEALLTPSFFLRRYGPASGLDSPLGTGAGAAKDAVSRVGEAASPQERKCLDMGFRPRTREFRDCQLQLSTAEAQAPQPAATLRAAQPQLTALEQAAMASRRARAEQDNSYQRLRDRLRADEINWEQAFIERMAPGALAPQLINFNLEQAVVKGSSIANVELQPGDVINVLRRKDVKGPGLQSTRLVRLQGEVAAPGIYQITPGESLAQLVARAGGATAQAYLFGTVLRRDSVLAQQRENLQQLVRQLESRLNAEQPTVVSGGSSEMVAAQQLLFQRNQDFKRQAIDRLRNIEPTGRVALEMDPLFTRLPNILLEDGDDILVPSVPSSIQVAGAVVNENALRFREGRTLKDVVQVAGALPSADLDRAFILRADGSAVLPQVESGEWFARRTMSRWFMQDPVQDVDLMPGDTVIVPDKVVVESGYSVFVRGLKDWTQIIYQLGISAAALRTLRD